MPNDQWKWTAKKKPAVKKPNPKHSVMTLAGHYAYCPDHGNKTSNYQGQDEGGVLFRCPESKEHTSHIFRVKVDPSAPRTIEEVAAWKEAQHLKTIATGGQ